MMPVTFPGWNLELTKPKELTDEECSAMPAYKDIDQNGWPFIATAWKPNKEDIDAILAGRPIYLKIYCEIHPVVALITMDENNQIN
jgi:hypothetical protein